MKRLTVLTVALALGVSSVTVLRAQDGPTTKPTAKPSMVKVAGVTGVFAQMTSLTMDQKTKIATLHHDAAAKIKAIEQQELADSMDVLSDDQKAEYQKIEADKKGSKRKMTKKPATEPS